MAAQTNDKKLNGSGLSTLWGLIKTHVSSSIAALSTVYAALSHNHTKSDITDLADATDSTGGLMTDAQAVKLAGIEAGAQVNTISGIQKNGTDIQPDATSKKVNIAIPTKTSDLTNDDNVVKDANYVHTDNNFTTALKNKLDGVESQAQVNTIESVKVNGSALTPDANKAVDITVPTNNNQLTNGAGYQTASDVNTLIDAKLTSTYKPQGSIAFANLPTPASTNLGYVWNMSDGFTIDNRFVEYESGKTKSYPAGSNVVVVEAGTDTYKFDVLAGFIDLSNYATLDDVEALTTAEIEAICV